MNLKNAFYDIPSKYDEKYLVHALNRLHIFMTDTEIKSYLGNINIIKYGELDSYNHINEILPENNSSCIILVETKYNVGHFVSIARKDNTIIQFDSYGSKIDTELNYISKIMKRILGEDRNELDNLIKKSNMNTIWNKTKYQSNKKVCGEQSSICGRACIVFNQLFRMGCSLEDMDKFIKNKKEQFERIYQIKIPTDLVFSLLIT